MTHRARTRGMTKTSSAQIRQRRGSLVRQSSDVRISGAVREKRGSKSHKYKILRTQPTQLFSSAVGVSTLRIVMRFGLFWGSETFLSLGLHRASKKTQLAVGRDYGVNKNRGSVEKTHLGCIENRTEQFYWISAARLSVLAKPATMSVAQRTERKNIYARHRPRTQLRTAKRSCSASQVLEFECQRKGG